MSSGVKDVEWAAKKFESCRTLTAQLKQGFESLVSLSPDSAVLAGYSLEIVRQNIAHKPRNHFGMKHHFSDKVSMSQEEIREDQVRVQL